MDSLNLSRIVDVEVHVSPLTAPRRTFNEGLIIGDTDGISAATRLKRYSQSYDAAMIADGYLATDPEYIAVGLYFSQTSKAPAPDYVWVGRRDLTAIKTVAINAGGTGYGVGDVLTITQSGASGGQVTVATVDGSGVILTLESAITARGTGYATGTGLATTVSPSGGTGATINITAVGETCLDAVTACRQANNEWYGVYACGAAKADILAMAGYIESLATTTRLFATTSDADVLTAADGSIGVALTALSYTRYNVIYSTTQDGAYPNNAYAGAALMGRAMGFFTGLANSRFTLNNTKLIGIATEPIDDTALDNILGANLDAYINFSSYYTVIQQGTGGKAFYDEGVFLDWFANEIQLTMMDLYYQALSVPQTDAGSTWQIQQANTVCKSAADMGFVAGGQWTGSPLLKLATDDMLPTGYLVQATSYTDQSQADREARKSVPLYIALKLAGSVHSIVIGVYVNR